MGEFDARINARRQALGLTYQQVHEALERRTWSPESGPPSLPVVGHWFNGRRRPRKHEHLAALCDVLQLSLDDVVGGAGPRLAPEERALLDGYRSLDPTTKLAILEIVGKLSSQGRA